MNKKKKSKSPKKKVFTHIFKIITDCPFETEKGVEHALISNCVGYHYKVEELSVF